MKALIGAVAATTLLAAPVSAEEAALQLGRFTFGASIGMLWGQANEYAYNSDGSKLSQLTWRYDNNAVAGGSIGWAPVEWLSIGVKGRVNLSDSSKMDDFDWGIAACPDSVCHSYHDDTALSRTGLVDVYTAVTLPVGSVVKVSGIAGYKWDYSKWQAHSGIANYGAMPAGLGIVYEQWWKVPYLGVEVKAVLDRFTISGRVSGSPWAKSHDNDQHIWTSTIFADRFSTTSMIEAGASVGYALTDTWTMKLEYDYQRWSLAKGTTTTTYQTSGITVETLGDVAGADNVTQTISVAASKTF